MNGIIKVFDFKKGYGFISCNNEDYFFHISDWQTKNIIPESGMDVEFNIAKSDKGLKAETVNLLKSMPKFITLKDDRIKLSNIMQYGIGYEKIEFEYFDKNQTLADKALKLNSTLKRAFNIHEVYDLIQDIKFHIEAYVKCYNIHDKRIDCIRDAVRTASLSSDFALNGDRYWENKTKEDCNKLIYFITNYQFMHENLNDYIDKSRRYLYVTTYQKCNYTYYDSKSFDIDEKIMEIDSYFSNYT